MLPATQFKRLCIDYNIMVHYLVVVFISSCTSMASHMCVSKISYYSSVRAVNNSSC